MTLPRYIFRLECRADVRRPLTSQSGFSLLEALITIVVVSIGLLGILGLQTASMVNTQVSATRGAATAVADTFAARMQANPDGDYDSIESITDFSTQTTNEAPDCSNGAACDTDTMTKYDIYQWSLALRRHLPNGRGFVDCIDTDCNVYGITIAWSEHDPLDRTAGQPDTDLCTTGPRKEQLDERCFVTEVRP